MAIQVCKLNVFNTVHCCILLLQLPSAVCVKLYDSTQFPLHLWTLADAVQMLSRYKCDCMCMPGCVEGPQHCAVPYGAVQYHADVNIVYIRSTVCYLNGSSMTANDTCRHIHCVHTQYCVLSERVFSDGQ